MPVGALRERARSEDLRTLEAQKARRRQRDLRRALGVVVLVLIAVAAMVADMAWLSERGR